MARTVETVALAISLFLVAFMAHAETVSAPIPDFAPGQEWSIKSTSPTTAKVVIGRVEAWQNTVCVSVSIVDVPISAEKAIEIVFQTITQHQN